MIALEVSERHLKQLQDECRLDRIDLSRLSWSGGKDGVFTARHDRPLVDLTGMLPDELDGGLTVTGSALAVEVRAHWMALQVQRAERKKVRLGRAAMSMCDVCKVPLDPQELRDFREHMRAQRRIAELRGQLDRARSAKAKRQADAAALAEMRAKYAVQPEAEPVQVEAVPTLAGQHGVPRTPGRPRKNTQANDAQPEVSHVQQ